ncbi:MAG TPA: hypothetical protein VG944_05365 [Fimbriimonas sp.]|nr:hypothetical protein [Fimbriimonas sp.]
MADDLTQGKTSKTYRLPNLVLLELADYCHCEKKKYTDTVKLAIMEYVHQGKIRRGEPYPPSPNREKILTSRKDNDED